MGLQKRVRKAKGRDEAIEAVRVRLAKGEPRRALALAKEIVNAFPEHGPGFRGLGDAYLDLGNPVEAIRAYRRARDCGLADTTLLLHLGIALRQTGAFGQAMDLYRQVLAAEPDAADAHCCLANALRARRDLYGAIKEYRATLRLDPRNLVAPNNLGLTLYDLGRYDEAEATWRAAITRFSGDADLYRNLGAVLWEKGRTRAAARAYAKAVRLRPDFTEAWFFLGQLREEKGKWRKAARAYRRALKADPNHADAHEWLDDLRKRTGKR